MAATYPQPSSTLSPPPTTNRRAVAMIMARWAQLGVLFSYLGIFLTDSGFTVTEVGYLYTFLMTGMTAGAYIIPITADYFEAHVRAAILSHAVMTLTMFLFYITPRGHFAWAACIMFVGSFFNGGYGPLVDSAVFQICAKHKTR